MKSGQVLTDRRYKWFEPEYWRFGDPASAEGQINYMRHASGQARSLSPSHPPITSTLPVASCRNRPFYPLATVLLPKCSCCLSNAMKGACVLPKMSQVQGRNGHRKGSNDAWPEERNSIND